VDGEQGGEMAQTMYAHMNKWIIKKWWNDRAQRKGQQINYYIEFREVHCFFPGDLFPKMQAP
jgi:hypothetical protein